MDIPTLLRLARLLDPSQAVIRPLLIKAHSHRKRSVPACHIESSPLLFRIHSYYKYYVHVHVLINSNTVYVFEIVYTFGKHTLYLESLVEFFLIN